MPPAFNPDAEHNDQSNGPHSSHTATGSRFNELDSRTHPMHPAAVSDAIAEYKKGTFTLEDARQLVFAMGYQIVEGKDTAALVARIAELEKQNGDLTARATGAESAFASVKAELESAKGK